MRSTFESDFQKDPMTKYATIAMALLAIVMVLGITQFIAPPFQDHGSEISFTMENTRHTIKMK